MNKTCTKCGETKPTTEFYKRSDARDGLQAHCKSCKKARSKAWYEANREEKKARDKAYYEANREKEKARHKAYYKTPAGKFSVYKKSAKVRGIPFLMEFQQFEGLWQKPCYYCEAEIKTIGLDRVDNDGPYHIDNVVPCCPPCNGSKKASTLDEWLERKNNVEAA